MCLSVRSIDGIFFSFSPAVRCESSIPELVFSFFFFLNRTASLFSVMLRLLVPHKRISRGAYTLHFQSHPGRSEMGSVIRNFLASFQIVVRLILSFFAIVVLPL